MKVICTSFPPSHTGGERATSPWVTVGAEYVVVSIIAEPARRVLIQILNDDGTLGLFDTATFRTIDDTVPISWTARIRDKGVLELAPTTWLAEGFWERYYDGEPGAVAAVDREMEILLRGSVP